MTAFTTIPDARLCADPRIGDLPSGGKVANIRIAHNFRVKEDGEWVSKAQFLDVALFRSAEAVGEYFHKGSAIIVSGELQTRTWTNKDGAEQETLELANATWTFPPKNDGAGAESQQSQPRQAAPKQQPAAVSQGDFADADIPF